MRTQVDEVTLEDRQTGAVITISSRASSHYLAAEIDWGVVEGKHHDYAFVGQIGTYVTGTTIGGREIEINAYVCGKNAEELSIYKKRLNQFFNPLHNVKLFYHNYFLSFKPVTSVKYQREWEENNTVFCKWQVQGYAEDPLWGDASESAVIGAAIVPGTFRFPFVIGTEDQSTVPPQQGKKVVMSYLAPSKIITIVNEGAIEVGMRVVITTRGTVVNPSIWDVKRQEFILINKTLVSGETIEVNTSDGQKIVKGKIHDTDEYENYYRYKDPDSTWLKVYPGANVYRYMADEGEDDMTVSIYYYNRYLEVEVADE